MILPPKKMNLPTETSREMKHVKIKAITCKNGNVGEREAMIATLNSLTRLHSIGMLMIDRKKKTKES